MSPLCFAAARNLYNVVVILLDLKCESIDPFFIVQSLRWASSARHIEVIKVLLDLELCQSFVANNDDGQEPVCDAARVGHVEVVKLFLKVVGFDIEKKNSEGETPLSLAQGMNRLEVVEVITKHMKRIKRRKRREIELREMREAIEALNTLD